MLRHPFPTANAAYFNWLFRICPVTFKTDVNEHTGESTATNQDTRHPFGCAFCTQEYGVGIKAE